MKTNTIFDKINNKKKEGYFKFQMTLKLLIEENMLVNSTVDHFLVYTG